MTANPASSSPRPTPPQPNWTWGYTIGLVAIVLVILVLGVATPSLHLQKLASWLINMGLFIAFLVVVGQGISGRPLGLLIDERNKMSLSRLQMVLWTVVILSGLLTIMLTNVSLEAAQAVPSGTAQAASPAFQPLNVDVPTDIWLLMGISTTSLIGSPLLKSNKMSSGKIDTNDTLHDAEVADLFRGEEVSNYNMLDLAKVQMFFFTLVLVLAYGVMLGGIFVANNAQGAASPIMSLPDVNSSMVTLLGISHAGYLTNKAVPHPEPPARPAG